MTNPIPENYKELILFLATAGVIVPLFARIRISPVLGFLAAGVFLGPFGLGHLAKDEPWLSLISITDVGQITYLAEFGVAFLLFMIALELSWKRLISMHKLVFGLGALQVVLSTAALALTALLLGQPPASAAVLGSALAKKRRHGPFWPKRGYPISKRCWKTCAANEIAGKPKRNGWQHSRSLISERKPRPGAVMVAAATKYRVKS